MQTTSAQYDKLLSDICIQRKDVLSSCGATNSRIHKKFYTKAELLWANKNGRLWAASVLRFNI